MGKMPHTELNKFLERKRIDEAYDEERRRRNLSFIRLAAFKREKARQRKQKSMRRDHD